MNREWRRPLDAFEEIMWLTDRRHVLVAELAASYSPNQYRTAIEDLNKNHPHLSTVVSKEPGRRPQLRYDSRVCPEVMVEECGSLPSLTECAEMQLNRPFPELQGPLNRWRVYVAGHRSVVSLASHHTLLDGRAHLQLLHEFMFLLTTGEEPEGSELLPALSELMGVPVPEAYGRDGEPEDRSTYPSQSVRASKVQVIHHQLPSEAWQIVKERSKARGGSLQSTILGALIAAGSELRLWGPESIRCMVSVDERSRIGRKNAIGSFFTLHPLDLDLSPNESLSRASARICGLFDKMRNADLSKRFLHEVNALVRSERRPAEMPEVLRSSYLAHQLMLTNYARYSPRTQFPDTTITGLLTAGATGGPKTQKVSAATVSGALHLTLASQEPHADLLTKTEAILKSAEHEQARTGAPA